MSTQLYPEVIDASTLSPSPAQNVYLPIAIEGQADAAGTATVAVVYAISRVDESVAAFGPASSLHRIVKAVLDSGAGPVLAVASSKASAPTLIQRQAAWEKLESDENARIRLTDSVTQADLVALATSCKNADLLGNKQIAFIGYANATDKATLGTNADGIEAGDAAGAKRTVIVAPGVYDAGGTLRTGCYAAAIVAAEVAKNADPSNDLDLWPLNALTAIEKGTDGMPFFRRKVVAGTPVNEFEDLLQDGISVLRPAAGSTAGVQTTHLRMVFNNNRLDTTWDNLATRVIYDQVFVDVRNAVYNAGFLREGNTPQTRLRVKSLVESILFERRSWISPVIQGDGIEGYNVGVTSSADQRQITVSYQGVIVRGINTIKVAANLSIPV